MAENFSDRLLNAIDAKGSPVCVGLDPVFSSLPDALKSDAHDDASRLHAVEIFCRTVLEAIAPIVPAVKPQSAYFEVFRGPGVQLYFNMIAYAQQLGLLVIGDVKRNDIGSTAAAYAQAHLAGPGAADGITINAYLGADGIEPFLNVSAKEGKGIFALVRTSNPSAKMTQDFADANGKPFYHHMAELIAELGNGESLLGQRGYSSLGAVVGATWPEEARQLRKIMPKQIFLVPGYGAQGGTAEDCAASFHEDGYGAIVNASRSVLYAHKRPEYAGLPWAVAVQEAAREFAEDIARVTLKK